KEQRCKIRDHSRDDPFARDRAENSAYLADVNPAECKPKKDSADRDPRSELQSNLRLRPGRFVLDHVRGSRGTARRGLGENQGGSIRKPQTKTRLYAT